MDGPMESMQCGPGGPVCGDWKRSSKKQARSEVLNISRLLAFREISPAMQRPKKRLWRAEMALEDEVTRDVRPANVKQALGEWLEADSLKHCSAKYTSLYPAPRSTIAAAFSLDGETLASTHGDHTVKIINCQSGKCVKVFSGHRRTPWVVRFHSRVRHVIASGSLDHEVRLWNATTSECIQKFDFLRPIASLAFHASGDLLAVASGHKLYMWQYNQEAEAATPAIVLRTRRSLRAVHFHPHGAPLLLTAEVNDLDTNDCPPATATARSYNTPAPHAPMAFTPATLSAMAMGHPARASIPPTQAGPHTQVTPAATANTSARPGWSPSRGTPSVPAPAGLVAGSPWSDFWAFEGQQHGRQGQHQGQGGPTFGFIPPPNPPYLGAFASPPDAGHLRNMPFQTPPQHPAHSYRGASPGVGPFPVAPEVRSAAQRPFSSPPLDQTAEQLTSRTTEGEAPVEMDVSPRPAESNRWLQRPDASIAPMSTSGTARSLSFSAAASGSQRTVLARTDSGGLDRTPSDPSEGMAIDLASVVSPPPPLSFLNVAPSPATRAAPAQTHSTPSQPAPNVALGYPFAAQLPALGIPPPQQVDFQFWGGWARFGQDAAGAPRGGPAPAAMGGPGPAPLQHIAQGGPQALSVASVAMAAAMAAARAAAQAGAGMMGAAAAGLPPGHLNQLARPFQDMGPAAEAAASAALAAAAAAELPCTVKLRVWSHNINKPTAVLDHEQCRLTIPHAVLCSEMGAHFSPCGRFLAACVACRAPPDQEDVFTQTLRALNGGSLHTFGGHQQRNVGPAPLQPDSPPQPLQSNSVVYELRLYSLEEGTFGEVLASRTVRAAHCLTSIQFSPTSQHILLAYGRRHNTLLRSLVTDGSGIIPVYTILEVYRVADMSLVRVLPSAEDEINVACFHPQVGGGLVYGTKEGKLRTVTHDRRPRQSGARRQLEDELLEAESNGGPYHTRESYNTEVGQARPMEAW